MTTTLQYFGTRQRAYTLVPPLLRTPCYQYRTWVSLLTCWLDFSLVGLGKIYFFPHPLGNINQFQKVLFPPKILNLPRHDERPC